MHAALTYHSRLSLVLRQMSINKMVTTCVLLIILCSYAHSLQLNQQQKGCVVTIDPFSTNQPLILSGNYSFLYPWPKRAIHLTESDTVIFYCSGSEITNSRDEWTAKSCSTIKSQYRDNQFHSKYVNCSKPVQNTARYSLTNELCANGQGRWIDIGFDLKSHHHFVTQYRSCFNTKTLSALFTVYNLTKSIGMQEHNHSRVDFQKGIFYDRNLDVARLYSKRAQRRTINNLLGIQTNSTTLIKNDSLHYFARGHLSAKGDFMYGAQQDATFYYVNVAPQWQAYNEGNWLLIEQSVRQFAHNRKTDLLVYTGVWGVVTMPHTNATNTHKPVALELNPSQHQIPIPELYWKLVYDPISQHAIALVTTNNPFLHANSTVCSDISRDIKWLTISKKPSKGHSYACSYSDFSKVVSYIPQLKVQNVLNA